jgi:hypothetical protein
MRGYLPATVVWRSVIGNNVGLFTTAVSGGLVTVTLRLGFNASRKTPTADEFRWLVTKAGFSDVAVSASRINVHLPR